MHERSIQCSGFFIWNPPNFRLNGTKNSRKKHQKLKFPVKILITRQIPITRPFRAITLTAYSYMASFSTGSHCLCNAICRPLLKTWKSILSPHPFFSTLSHKATFFDFYCLSGHFFRLFGCHIAGFSIHQFLFQWI